MKQSKSKCFVCGREFKNVYVRKGCYEPMTVASKGVFHLGGRFQWGRSHWTLLLSQESEYPTKRANARPICLECFITKLNQALLALKEDDETQQPADEEKQEVAATASASAPEVTKEEPFDYDKLTDEEKNRQYWRLFAEKGDEPTELEKRQNRVWTQNEVRRRQLKNLPI